MTDSKESPLARRKFLKLVSSGALAVPVMGLTACGGGDSGSSAPAAARPEPTPPPAPAAEPQMAAPEPAPEPAPAAEPVAEAAPTETPAAEDMPILSPSDPQASALGYTDDASTVDAAKYPQYAEGRACANCALYTAEGEPLGPCSIFPGKRVNANGWCSVYAPKMM